ncbi:unnamed protein product [Symbiodinium necroappetens]|uniref:Macro domain-containing protein n=1 Tax=Symbiodinium necroappetens TaxID=1628268 RepID=A0A812K526_9DINO|nr:unnamed protein product [Symbiodinium necroappetens]
MVQDWFEQLFGFVEVDYDRTKQLLRVHGSDSGLLLESLVNKKSYCVGSFGTPSLGELRAEFLSLGEHGRGRLQVQNEIGDVAAKHALPANRHATFQVASQFNCLEFVGPSVTPEDGITGYVRDRTQGPACSIACGPATAYRNFFAPVRGQTGQASRNQINNLEDLCVEIDRKSAKRRRGSDGFSGPSLGSRFLEVRGGYTLASHRQLAHLNAVLRSLSEEELDELRQCLRVGLHADVQVTSFAWGSRAVKDSGQQVTQVFGSACSVACNRESSQQDWEPLARLVLEASYEATLLSALLQARRHGGEDGSRRVFLTCLGGGVFGNHMAWIADAMRRAFACLQDEDLDVRIITYAGSPAPELVRLEQDPFGTKSKPGPQSTGSCYGGSGT